VSDHYFSCMRCGNCCRVGHGRVWLDAGDLQAMADLTGMSAAAFRRDKVVSVGRRLSLRERPDGACILLDGQAECTVYEARPAQCRSFPQWPQLQSPEGLRAAAAYCPGIQLFPDDAVLREVLPQIAACVQAAGGTVDEAAAERWACSLEVDLHLITGESCIPVDPGQALIALQQLAENARYPWSYGPWTRLLADRRAGWLARGGIPSRPD